MKGRCEICGKSRLRGKWVPRLIGKRVPKRTTRFQRPNIQKVKIEGERYILCTRCLKTLKRLKNEENESVEAKANV